MEKFVKLTWVYRLSFRLRLKAAAMDTKHVSMLHSVVLNHVLNSEVVSGSSCISLVAGAGLSIVVMTEGANNEYGIARPIFTTRVMKAVAGLWRPT